MHSFQIGHLGAGARSVVVLLLLLSCLLPARAADLERLRLNGFGSIGVMHVDAPDGWAFRHSHDQPRRDSDWRADVDSRLGLQANYELTSDVEAVTQVLLRQQVESQPLQLAFLAWRPQPGLTVRLGRTNNDVFMYSESRHVGFSYPWARTNHETNGPLPIYTLDGVDATWRWAQGAAFWSLHGFFGTGNSAVAGLSGEADLRYDVNRLAGATLARQQDGLQVRATMAFVRGQIERTAQLGQALALLDTIGRLPLPAGTHAAADARTISGRAGDASSPRRITYLSLGSSYDDGGAWTAALEVIAAMADRPVGDARMGFASVARRMGPVTLFMAAGAGRFSDRWRPHADWQAELAPAIGPEAALQAAQVMTRLNRQMLSGSVRQHSVSVGMRWDLHPRAALKLQLDRYGVAQGGSLYWTNGEARSARPLVASASLDFVF